eukprot:GHUV01048186.1.p2 GENE.GHUV01048186.1~~GHUV01048186.1.p2  ORF type:complete len:103 (-),score=7.25 GHUV01048186.1:174-482(-)
MRLPTAVPQMGQIFESAVVARVDPGLGLLLQLPMEPEAGNSLVALAIEVVVYSGVYCSMQTVCGVWITTSGGQEITMCVCKPEWFSCVVHTRYSVGNETALR